MKTSRTLAKTLAVCSLTLLFAGIVGAAPMQKEAKVIATSGVVQYSTGGDWLPVSNNAKLIQGTTVQTGPNSSVYFSLESGAILCLAPNSTLRLDKMAQISGDTQDTETQINLRAGQLIGTVKKLSKASHFDVKTPNGVAGVSDAKFHIKVEEQADASFKVTFTSIQNQVVVAALVSGSNEPDVKILNTGDSWTPGNDVVQVAASFVAEYLNQLAAAERILGSTATVFGTGSVFNPNTMTTDASPWSP